jgi:hypothetical protein
MKTSPLGGELFNEDERADVTKLIVAFRNLANAPIDTPCIMSTALRKPICGVNRKVFHEGREGKKKERKKKKKKKTVLHKGI